ncbi:MAG: hypothetical protein IKS20_12940 [Victivallales bacterium]|nr:hypothetical protein [Victivallales bacterium]
MTIRKMFFALIAAGIGIMISMQAYAQEKENEAADNNAAQEQAAEQQEVPAQVVSDGGIEAVREAQESAPAPADKKFKNAFKLLKEQAKAKKWKEGWDKKKQRIIIIESAEFKTSDPASDKDFFIKREMATKKAYLSAKVGIISTINQEMSAIDIASMPGTDVNKVLGAERDQLDKEIAREKEELAQLVEKTSKAEAEALRGTTFGERLNDLLAALIKKIDAEYKKNERDEAKIARFQELKRKLEISKKKYAELQEKAEAMQASVRERQESAVEAIAKMPLYGSSVIMQTESWNKSNGKYQVAVMFCWSMVMERSARAIVTGEEFTVKPSANAKSVQDWLEDQNPATMIGPRQYIDKDGNRWFLGISARQYDEELSSSERRKNKGLADLYAQQMAAFCVWADVESYKMAKTAMESRGNEKVQRDVVAESYSERLTQSFQNKTIRGMQRLFSDEVEHPITGGTIYVSVYGINPNDAKTALEIEKINYATAVMDNRHQTVERGRKAANKAAVEASKNRQEDFQKGYNQQKKAVDGELQKRQPKKKGVQVLDDGNGGTKKEKKSTSGAFGGDTDVNDDF